MPGLRIRAFTRYVEHVLSLDCGTEIKSFRVKRYFPAKQKYNFMVDTWIKYAPKKKVQNLEIDFSKKEPNYIYDYYKIFKFLDWSLPKKNKEKDTLKHLTLSSCLLEFPR
ncbi:hypothetical protein L484_000438 [Morus notabilis]|uniref:Uncharacterized protein n=1 Tax=Morus notabilis TaxID=981085 RepID=W9T2N5_9ROSA|nr:hypothetical protein L484_000438 [Morus notabilis]